MAPASGPRRTRGPSLDVVFVVYPDLQGLDLQGPYEVFATANEEAGRPVYRLIVAAPHSGWVRTSSGMRIAVDRPLAELRRPIDTLVVVGGDGTAQAYADTELVEQVRRLA